jgi:hypothetical protein
MTFNNETKGLLGLSPTWLHKANRHFSVPDNFLFYPLLSFGNKGESRVPKNNSCFQFV